VQSDDPFLRTRARIGRRAIAQAAMRRLDGLRRLSLVWRLFLVESAVLILAAVLLAIGPITISSPVLVSELAVLGVGLGTLLVVTLMLLRRTLRPLDTLTRTMHRIDPLSPGQRVPVDASDADVAALATAFNDMLDRLERERRESARMALSVQEAERRRVARELHDEVAQTLTAILLQLEGLGTAVPDDLREEIKEVRETARTGAADVRRIAPRLRP
jgi:two-component system sensor histidine kinase UhpB